MAKVIHRCPIAPGTMTVIPAGEILRVGFSRGELAVWVERPVDTGTGQPVPGEQQVAAVPTGAEFSGAGDYVGSAVSDELVYHVYHNAGHFQLH
jgi:hypothetical protein